jgi:hypothetical protein
MCTEVTGLPIYKYEFNPPQPGDITPAIPNIILTTGTHGNEKASTWTAYQFFKQLCENWGNSPVLEYLRWSIAFIIIPVVNPYGFNTYQKLNSNGVDIDRNFPDYWEARTAGDVNYGGDTPLSELESQYVDNVLKDELNIIYVCDFHSSTAPPDNNYFVWNAAADMFNARVSTGLISKLSRKWAGDQGLPIGEYFGYSSVLKAGTIAQRAYTSYGVDSSTFEIGEQFRLESPSPKQYSALTFQMGIEALVNWLAMVIRNTIPIINSR